MPHLLLYGPSGSGKSLALSILVKELFGSKENDNVLYLRSTDELGITTVRTKIKYFSQRATGDTGVKMIVIEDTDAMTSVAQAALRRIMETQSTTTRFCMTCTSIGRIIDPIVSRCVTFRMKSVPDSHVRNVLCNICDRENVTKDIVNEIVTSSQGDLRNAIILLEVHSLSKIELDTKPIKSIVDEIFEGLLSKDTIRLQTIVNHIHNHSIPYNKVINLILERVLALPIHDKDRARICLLAGKIAPRLQVLDSTRIHLLHFVYSLLLLTTEQINHVSPLN